MGVKEIIGAGTLIFLAVIVFIIYTIGISVIYIFDTEIYTAKQLFNVSRTRVFIVGSITTVLLMIVSTFIRNIYYYLKNIKR